MAMMTQKQIADSLGCAKTRVYRYIVKNEIIADCSNGSTQYYGEQTVRRIMDDLAPILEAERAAGKAQRYRVGLSERYGSPSEQFEPDPDTADSPAVPRSDADHFTASQIITEQSDSERIDAVQSNAEYTEAVRNDTERIKAKQSERVKIIYDSTNGSALKQWISYMDNPEADLKTEHDDRDSSLRFDTVQNDSQRVDAERIGSERFISVQGVSIQSDAEQTETVQNDAHRFDPTQNAAQNETYQSDSEQINAFQNTSERVDSNHSRSSQNDSPRNEAVQSDSELSLVIREMSEYRRIMEQQLAMKDKQIESLSAALADTTTALRSAQASLADTTTALRAAQALHAGTMQEHMLETSENDNLPDSQPEEKQGILARIFGKKLF